MFAVKTNPYLENVIASTSIGGDESTSPVARQFRHSDEEYKELPLERLDYLGEDTRTYCDGLVTQKYPNRMLVYCSDTCAALCRHCTRKRKVNDTGALEVSDAQLQLMMQYMKEHHIKDVLLSGGDPFMLSKDELFRVVKAVNIGFAGMSLENQMPGVIRIGTRVPCTLPVLFGRYWSDIDILTLKKLGVKYINVQFNCVEELTSEAIDALEMISSCGIALGNQSVLLKGVNDSTEKLVALNEKLYQLGVKPYYLYSCDLIPGMSHFRVSLKRGIEIYEKMRGNISGMANPLYIADLPDGMGKVPINPHYYTLVEEGVYKFVNYQGRSFTYNDKEVTVGEY